MMLWDLCEKLTEYDRSLKVYVLMEDKTMPIKGITWSAVDPSLSTPETVLIEIENESEAHPSVQKN